MLSAVTLTVIMLSASMLNVVMPTVTAPLKNHVILIPQPFFTEEEVENLALLVFHQTHCVKKSGENSDNYQKRYKFVKHLL